MKIVHEHKEYLKIRLNHKDAQELRENLFELKAHNDASEKLVTTLDAFLCGEF